MAFIKESVSFFSYQEWIYFKNVTALNQISQVFELIYPSQDSVMLRKTLDPKNKKRDKSSDLPLILLFLLDLNQGPSD